MEDTFDMHKPPDSWKIEGKQWLVNGVTPKEATTPQNLEFESHLAAVEHMYAQKDMTREMLVKLLILHKDRKKLDYAKVDCFADVKDANFGKYICYALDKGLVSGRNKTTFDPLTLVTRSEALKMIFSINAIPVTRDLTRTSFNDTSKTDWFSPYVETAKTMGLLDDVKDTFRPEEKATTEFVLGILKKVEGK